jgi:hypothetical protein
MSLSTSSIVMPGYLSYRRERFKTCRRPSRTQCRRVIVTMLDALARHLDIELSIEESKGDSVACAFGGGAIVDDASRTQC